MDLDRFHQAVVTFTKSLAGYSVVTFVLVRFKGECWDGYER